MTSQEGRPLSSCPVMKTARFLRELCIHRWVPCWSSPMALLLPLFMREAAYPMAVISTSFALTYYTVPLLLSFKIHARIFCYIAFRMLRRWQTISQTVRSACKGDIRMFEEGPCRGRGSFLHCYDRATTPHDPLTCLVVWTWYAAHNPSVVWRQQHCTEGLAEGTQDRWPADRSAVMWGSSSSLTQETSSDFRYADPLRILCLDKLMSIRQPLVHGIVCHLPLTWNF